MDRGHSLELGFRGSPFIYVFSESKNDVIFSSENCILQPKESQHISRAR